MKFKKTVLRNNEDISKVNFEFVKECFESLNSLLKVDKYLLPSDEFKVNFPEEFESEDDYQFDRLDNLEEFISKPQPTLLLVLGREYAGNTVPVGRRLNSFATDFINFYKDSEEYIKPYIPLTDEQVKHLKLLCKNAIGNLSTFIYYEFELDDTLTQIKSGEEITVNIDIYNYIQEQKWDLAKTIERLKASVESYRPNLPIFEAHPELEDDFYDKAGAYVHDFDLVDALLTLDDVIKVATGAITDLEKFIKEVEGRGKIDGLEKSDSF